MEGIRGIQHPLQTPLVLECILENLGVSDLKTCRQVCRAWRKEATPVVRPLTKVTIRGDEEGKGVADFLELVQSEASTFSESPFVSKFQIRGLNYREQGPAFWEFCGRSIKSLHLSRVSFESYDEFCLVIFQSCPNLEELFLDVVDVDAEGNVGDQPVIWMPPRFPQNRNLKCLCLENTDINGLARMEILSHFPSLEKLTPGDIEDNGDWVFRSLTILRERDNQGWPLKSLTLDLRCLEEPLAILPVLVEGNLALEEFDAHGTADPEHGIVIRRILEAHANSLKKPTLGLSLDDDDDDDNNDDDVFAGLNNVRLEKLEFLSLSCVDLSSTNFLRNVPNLRRLEICESRVLQPEDTNDDWVLHNCTELYLNVGELEEGDLQKFIRRLPNLEKLRVGWCDNERFAVICELCPRLTYLHLWGSEMDDCGISGLDLEDVERINQEGANGWTWWRPITVARLNLSSLKSLKWFDFSADTSLGFCSALCGVQQLPQLQHLCLEGFSLEVPIWKRLIDQFPWVDQ